jgi:hypothetical protein
MEYVYKAGIIDFCHKFHFECFDLHHITSHRFCILTAAETVIRSGQLDPETPGHSPVCVIMVISLNITDVLNGTNKYVGSKLPFSVCENIDLSHTGIFHNISQPNQHSTMINPSRLQ